MSILVIGSLNADRAFHLPRAPEAGETLTAHHMALAAGGKGANQAVAAARASRAARSVRMIGRVGADGDGEMMRAALIEAGVDAIGVQALPDRPTGTAFIVVEETGENRIIVSPGANEGLSPADIEAEDFADAGMVLLQLEVPLATVGAAAQKAAREGRTVILDPAPAVPLSQTLIAAAALLTPNRTELATLLGVAPPAEGVPHGELADLARRLIHGEDQAVIVKLGAEGALHVTETTHTHWPAHPVTHIRDTTAAGDAWNGAFAVALAEGRPLSEAGQFACTAAALAVTRPGAIPSLAARTEIEAAFTAQD